MSLFVNTYVDKEENEDKARVEFEINDIDENGSEILIDRYIHIIDTDR